LGKSRVNSFEIFGLLTDARISEFAQRWIQNGIWLPGKRKLIVRSISFCRRLRRDPATITRRMRYSLFGRGKKAPAHPLLAAAEACEGKIEQRCHSPVRSNASHTYSLIHDDLRAWITMTSGEAAPLVIRFSVTESRFFGGRRFAHIGV